MAQQRFYVKALDQEGNVLVDETIATLPNGFFELWLPRNRRIMLSIQGGNLTGKGVIETFPDSKTCVTTIQLQ